MPAAFRRYVGIDYSGARTPTDGLKGLRVYIAQTPGELPEEVLPPPGPRKYWSRRGVAFWLADLLQEDIPTIVGIDHSFSFPLRYFEVHQLLPDWYAFLEDFQAHWPTDEEHVYVDFVRDGLIGNGAAREGNPRWRRMAEERCRAKSVFHFDVQGTVAKSTHSGIPWLLYPGTVIRAGATAVVQAYPQVRIFCIIAAVPRIAMTRLRLYARTWRLISVLTCSRVFIRKCAAPIHNFSVPNGCSTV